MNENIKEEIEREDKFQELKKIENEFKILKNETKKNIKKIWKNKHYFYRTLKIYGQF